MNMIDRHKARLDRCIRFREVVLLLDKLGCPEPVNIGAAHLSWSLSGGLPTSPPCVYMPGFEGKSFVFAIPKTPTGMDSEDVEAWPDVVRVATWFVDELRRLGYR
jgi:hypothetical protein